MRQPLDGMSVAVIGAGVVGAACAYALTLAGARVHVYESEFEGAGTTAEGMGHLVTMDDTPAMLALCSYSVRKWSQWLPILGPRVECRSTGTLWIAELDAEIELLKAKQARLASADVSSELLSAKEMAQREPHLAENLAGGLVVSSDSVIYPIAAAHELVAAACRLGATYSGGQSVVRMDDQLVSNGKPLAEDAIVLATGLGTNSLAPEVPPIRSRKGQLAITDRYPHLCRHQLIEVGYGAKAAGGSSESIAFNIQPRATGQMLIGSSRQDSTDPAIDRRLLGSMLRRAMRFVPAVSELSVIRVWTGFRPSTPDKLPYIGPVPGRIGWWVAAGHEGLGITQATGTADLLVQLMAGLPTAIDPAPFSSSRSVPNQPELELSSSAPSSLANPFETAHPACDAPQPPMVNIFVNGERVRAKHGSTVAAALANAGHRSLRQSISGHSRGALCAMGVCFECRCTIDGATYERACMTFVREGMDVRTDG